MNNSIKKQLKISLICAIAENRAIGRNNKLLWDIPDDLRHFKEITKGHAVVMGQKTFESIGHPLPHRKNIIITNDQNFKAAGCIIAYSIEEAFAKAKEVEKEEIFVIGGGSIYAQTIGLADKLYLTIVGEEILDADTFFPDYSEFKNILSEEPRESNGLRYKFVELVK